jgi:hypothetical protein
MRSAINIKMCIKLKRHSWKKSNLFLQWWNYFSFYLYFSSSFYLFFGGGGGRMAKWPVHKVQKIVNYSSRPYICLLLSKT